ncbi:MAG: amidohydrolase family protein [Roseiflexaceae bacterium]
MPDFPIIDAHVHLWNPQLFRIPWLDDLDAINRPFGPAEYREHTQGVDVEAFVYVEVAVEPAYALLEAQWADQVAGQEPRLRGIVAAAPLEYGEQIRYYLEALAAIGPRVKGVRRLLQGEADPNYCLRPEFVRGVRLLPEFGFSFDICIKHHQLAAAVELVRQCPATSFILDHIAKPDIANHLLDPWREQMRDLAALPNVVCKVSGMVTEADQQGWMADDLAPYVAHVLEVFGADRVLFGGDWPVVLLASSHARWVETLDALTTQLAPEARRKLWAENARRFYRLGQ